MCFWCSLVILCCTFGVLWCFFVMCFWCSLVIFCCAFGVLWCFFVMCFWCSLVIFCCAFGVLWCFFVMWFWCFSTALCYVLLLLFDASLLHALVVFCEFFGFNVCFYICVHGWKHTRGGQKCCHIVYFFKDVHVWTSTMVILKHIFSKFLHNLVDYNTKKLIAKEIPFSNLYCEAPKYMRGKKMYATLY